jgi:hypothetical protein
VPPSTLSERTSTTKRRGSAGEGQHARRFGTIAPLIRVMARPTRYRTRLNIEQLAFCTLVFLAVLGLGTGGCGSSPSEPAGAGGSAETGLAGATGTGGAAGRGGSSATGGTSSGGGVTGSGGAAGLGGSTGSGGSGGYAGITGTGAAGSRGGSPGTGGAAATGAGGNGGTAGATGGGGSSSHTGTWHIMPLGDSITGSTCYPQLLSKELISSASAVCCACTSAPISTPVSVRSTGHSTSCLRAGPGDGSRRRGLSARDPADGRDARASRTHGRTGVSRFQQGGICGRNAVHENETAHRGGCRARHAVSLLRHERP